jgi:ribosomal-protein-alanine N-acetyltransferase
MRAVIARWQKSGSTVLLLEVRQSNAAARALYAKHGFHETGRRRAYYRDPDEDAVLYALARQQ